ncbi:MAG: PTS sugar transporter subunit IIA [Spirochaetia bacterium]
MFKKELISLDFNAKTRQEVIKHLADLFLSNQCLSEDINAQKKFIQAVEERENTGSTALGLGFAIPHGRCDVVSSPAVAFVRLASAVQWDEDEQVDFIFLLGVPESAQGGNNHLHVLAKLSGAIMEDAFREELQRATSNNEVLAILNTYTSK